MLKWKVVTEDEKLKGIIKRTKETFDKWFAECWAHQVSREKMLSPESPLPHVYYKMCKPFDEVKAKYPNEGKETCSDCGKITDVWIETSFSFCDEYGCGLSLCPKCANKLKTAIEKMEKVKS